VTDDQPQDPPAVDDDGNDDDSAPARTPESYGPDPTVPSATARTLSSFIDVVFAVVVYIVSLSLIGLVIHTKAGTALTDGQKIAVSLTFVAVEVLVFSILERTGGTPGRRLTRLRLVMMDLSRPGWTPLFVRYLAVFVPVINIVGVLLVFVGVTMSGFQRQRRDAFDLLSRTRVIPAAQVDKGDGASS
jgi:uncharacterized RDD family membrane protein YckC